MSERRFTGRAAPVLGALALIVLLFVLTWARRAVPPAVSPLEWWAILLASLAPALVFCLMLLTEREYPPRRALRLLRVCLAAWLLLQLAVSYLVPGRPSLGGALAPGFDAVAWGTLAGAVVCLITLPFYRLRIRGASRTFRQMVEHGEARPVRLGWTLGLQDPGEGSVALEPSNKRINLTR